MWLEIQTFKGKVEHIALLDEEITSDVQPGLYKALLRVKGSHFNTATIDIMRRVDKVPTMPVERWLVRDPKGREHYISRDFGGFSDTENLAWFAAKHEQPDVVKNMLDRLILTPELGYWAEYAWLRL